MLLEKLKLISIELNKYANLSKEEVFTLCVKEKLDASLEKYLKELNIDLKNYDYMMNTDFDLKFVDQDKARTRTFKRLVKIQKEQSEKK